MKSPDARFDTYNAKWLTPDEVARSFVPPPIFQEIAKRRNTLIVGPRGSGKTTLLKMLTESALERWEGRRARVFRSAIDYTGVFVATDVSWNFQVSSLGNSTLSAVQRQRLQWASLTAHTHQALVGAMEGRAAQLMTQRGILDQTNAIEARLVSELTLIWKIEPKVPSFVSLKSALRRRLQHIYELAATAKDDSLATNSPDFLSVPLLISCRSAVEHFNDVVGEQGHYWAFLFDEVELLPLAVREELYRYLRAFPGPVIIKLALSPFDDELPKLDGTDAPQRDADYDFVPLWYPKKRTAYRFCRNLWDAILSGTAMEGLKPEDVLGKSLLDTENADWSGQGTAYTRNSSHHRYLSDLADSDVGFGQYLASHNIRLDAIEQIKGTARASTLRKVFPLVVARVEMRRMGPENPALRSRKVSNLYTGATSIFDISEGNPRRFIGLVSRMLERLNEGQVRLEPSAEADEITQAAARYRALLRTIVVPDVSPSTFKRGLLSLLDPIGKRLQEMALVDWFSPEPPGTFIVDSHLDDEAIRLIGYALNMGAIVHVPDREADEQLLSSSRLRGKKLRLSYLLAAFYGIPPRLGRHISLRELLRGKRNSSSDSSQSLFGEQA